MNTPTTPAPIADDLFELFDALREERLDDAGRAELTRRIESDPAALDAYALYVALWGTLERDAAPRTATSDTLAEAAPVIATIRPARTRWPLAAAAAILVAAAVVAIYLLGIAGDPAATGHGSDADAPVATMLDTTGGGTLTAGDTIVTPGSEIPTGDLRLDTGSAEFQLASGVTVQLRGATRMTVHGPMSATLTEGVAVFHCPPGTEGYTVNLPDACRVVDLGTRFAARVLPDGTAAVQVLDGSVRLETPTGHRVLTYERAAEVVDSVATELTDPARLVVTPPAPPVDADAFAHAVRELGPTAYWTGTAPIDGAVTDVVANRAARIEGTLAASDDDAPLLVSDGAVKLVVDPDATLNDPGNRVTVMAWVRLDSRDGQALIHNWNGGLGYSLEIYEGRANFTVAFSNDYADVVGATDPAPMPLGRWVLLVGVYDGSRVALYVDGRPVAAAPTRGTDLPINATAGPIAIGGRSDADWGHARGAIDHIALFNRVLTPAEVSGLTHPNPSPTGEAAPR